MKLREPDSVMKNWPATERPVERLIANGVEALSDAELLAVLLRSGEDGKSAVDVARDAMSKAGGLTNIAYRNGATETGIRADGMARVAAAMEFARRVLKERMQQGNALNSPSAVREYLRLKLQPLPYEVFMCLFLDAQNRVIEIEELFKGTLTQTSVYPREVVKAALRHNCGAVVFAHNHPSGVAEPSHADETLTQALKQALALIDVRVLDHFIVAGSGVLSFAERGLI